MNRPTVCFPISGASKALEIEQNGGVLDVVRSENRRPRTENRSPSCSAKCGFHGLFRFRFAFFLLCPNNADRATRFLISDFGFRTSDLFRLADFGFRICLIGGAAWSR